MTNDQRLQSDICFLFPRPWCRFYATHMNAVNVPSTNTSSNTRPPKPDAPNSLESECVGICYEINEFTLCGWHYKQANKNGLIKLSIMRQPHTRSGNQIRAWVWKSQSAGKWLATRALLIRNVCTLRLEINCSWPKISVTFSGFIYHRFALAADRTGIGWRS